MQLRATACLVIPRATIEPNFIVKLNNGLKFILMRWKADFRRILRRDRAMHSPSFSIDRTNAACLKQQNEDGVFCGWFCRSVDNCVTQRQRNVCYQSDEKQDVQHECMTQFLLTLKIIAFLNFQNCTAVILL